PDRSTTACAYETAADKTLHGIVRIGAGRQAQDQPGRYHAGDNSPVFHLGISSVLAACRFGQYDEGSSTTQVRNTARQTYIPTNDTSCRHHCVSFLEPERATRMGNTHLPRIDPN